MYDTPIWLLLVIGLFLLAGIVFVVTVTICVIARVLGSNNPQYGGRRYEQVRTRTGSDRLDELRAASRSLQNLNRSYESLVQQSNRSTALLLDLCRLYTHVPAPVHGPAPNSLSCEA